MSEKCNQLIYKICEIPLPKFVKMKEELMGTLGNL